MKNEYLLKINAKDRRVHSVKRKSETIYDDLSRIVGGWQEYFRAVKIGGYELAFYCNDSGRLIPNMPLNPAMIHFYPGPICGDVAIALSTTDPDHAIRALSLEEAAVISAAFNASLERFPAEYYKAWEEQWKVKPHDGLKHFSFNTAEEMQEFIKKTQEENTKKAKKLREDLGYKDE